MSAWAAGPPKLVAKADAQDWALGTTVKLLTTGSSTPVEGQVWQQRTRGRVARGHKHPPQAVLACGKAGRLTDVRAPPPGVCG